MWKCHYIWYIAYRKGTLCVWVCVCVLVRDKNSCTLIFAIIYIFRSSNPIDCYHMNGPKANLFIWLKTEWKYPTIQHQTKKKIQRQTCTKMICWVAIERESSRFAQIYCVAAGFGDFRRNCNFVVDLLRGDFRHFLLVQFFCCCSLLISLIFLHFLSSCIC